jgi:probable H4MPT-linked C1 transfer pathway protein
MAPAVSFDEVDRDVNWLGLDIGGANIKAADGRGWARSVPFALWRDPHGLSAALRGVLEEAPRFGSVAVTMTGELCDCFRSKADGVRHILASVKTAAAGRDVLVYLVDGRFVEVEEARDVPYLAAASNWHALAAFACRFVPDGEDGLLIDIGSTTTDIVPLVGGRPCAKGQSDTERLLAGELVYTGVGRTPVCAVVDSLPWRGLDCPVAAELFATTGDAYATIGELAEDPDAKWTADGRPLTLEYARERLARMICADKSSFDSTDARVAAEAICASQVERLDVAMRTVLAGLSDRPCTFVLSGSGEFLARRLAACVQGEAKLVSLEKVLGAAASASATAHAVAILAAEAR